jgi:hypothetical protein
MKGLYRTLAAATLLLAAAGFCRAATSHDWRGWRYRATVTTVAAAVSHSEPPQEGDYWTPRRMREAKPFPMPTRDWPPPPPKQWTPAVPYPGPPSSSPPGAGGPPR